MLDGQLELLDVVQGKGIRRVGHMLVFLGNSHMKCLPLSPSSPVRASPPPAPPEWGRTSRQRRSQGQEVRWRWQGREAGLSGRICKYCTTDPPSCSQGYPLLPRVRDKYKLKAHRDILSELQITVARTNDTVYRLAALHYSGLGKDETVLGLGPLQVESLHHAVCPPRAPHGEETALIRALLLQSRAPTAFLSMFI